MAKKIKLTPIKKVCSLTKETVYGGYVHVCVNVVTGFVYASYYPDIHTYPIYDNPNIIFVDSFYSPTSMKDIRERLLCCLDFKGYSDFC